MTHTRYSPGNVALLFMAGLVSLFITFLAVMTAGFGADPVHDYQSFAVACLVLIALLSTPLWLIMLRWSSVGYFGAWSVTACWALICLVLGMRFSGLVVLLAIQSLISGAIHSRSKEEASRSG